MITSKDVEQLEDLINRFGKAHEVTHAQMESRGLSNSLTLYSIKPHEYDSKGKYRY